MSNQWTKEQEMVIKLRERNLLVSAAAGSGKTAVLIERILKRLTDQEHPLDIDRLLVVTFTRAAAGEMRERLSLAIENCLAEDCENEHLIRQLTLIQNAQITTIDSFCSYLLKNYFHVIGLNPGYRVMDEGEGRLLKEEVLSDLLNDQYDKAEEEFLEFAESFAPGKTDGILEDYVLRLYEFAMSYPFPEKWLSDSIQAYECSSLEELLKSDWAENLKGSVKGLLRELQGLVEQALSITKEADGPYMYQDALLSDREWIDTLCGADTLLELSERMREAPGFARLSSKKDENVSPEKREAVKGLRERVKDGITELTEQYFFASLEEQYKDLKACARPMKTLVTLTILFKQQFESRKREKNILDFHDMEHLALKILVEEKDERIVPTETARELAGEFEEIMIDEYQDSNLVQETLLRAVSGIWEGRNNLFMVGDVKQSIYRFRLARPELFMEKYHTYTKEESESQRIDLSRNFRSRREILAFTNQVFQGVMQEHLGGIRYDEDAALYPGAKYPEADPEFVKPELLFLDVDRAPELKERSMETDTELSARMVGNKILAMVGKEKVLDKETRTMRPVEYRDIVLLFRSPSGIADSYQKILTSMGIPTYAGSRTGYFSAREVQVMLSLLKLIDNPRQDIPLAAVLVSPVVGLSSREMALLKGKEEDGLPFWQAAYQYRESGAEEGLRRKMAEFYDLLDEFRERVPYTPIHELLWYVCDRTGLVDYYSAMPSGAARELNLKMLVQKAWDYEKTSYRGLFNFIRYIEKLQKFSVDYGEASAISEDADVVRIMSIHKSKGLEFPIVILGGLEKQFNQQDVRNRLVMDADLGAACDLLDPEKRIRKPTLFKRWVQKKVKDDNLAEEIRVLYVALTRAKEKLILSAAVKDLGGKAKNWYQTALECREGFSYQALSSAKGYLDFLMPSLLLRPGASGFREEYGLPGKGETEGSLEDDWNTDFKIRVMDVEDLFAEEMGQQVRDTLTFGELTHWNGDKVYDGELREALQKHEGTEYPYGDARSLPAKLTVSELKKRYQEAMEPEEESSALYPEEPKSRIPSFMEEKQEVRGAHRGTVYHTFLQYLDFEKTADQEGIRNQVEAMQKEGRLTGEEAAVIDPLKILLFVRSPLGKRMREAAKNGKLFREQHFVCRVEAGTVFPEVKTEGSILIQGVIDAYFEEDGECVLVDYKTDFVEKGKEREFYEKYAPQLFFYQRALCQLTGKNVKDTILYSFWLQKELRKERIEI